MVSIQLDIEQVSISAHQKYQVKKHNRVLGPQATLQAVVIVCRLRWSEVEACSAGWRLSTSLLTSLLTEVAITLPLVTWQLIRKLQELFQEGPC